MCYGMHWGCVHNRTEGKTAPLMGYLMYLMFIGLVKAVHAPYRYYIVMRQPRVAQVPREPNVIRGYYRHTLAITARHQLKTGFMPTQQKVSAVKPTA